MASRQTEGNLPFSSLARSRRRSLRGACLGHFCCNYALYLMFSWRPFYPVNNRDLPVTAMARFGGLLYLGYAISAVVSGWAARASSR